MTPNADGMNHVDGVAPPSQPVSQPSDLVEAMRDLDEVNEEAEEEGYPVPAELAATNARRLLTEMYGMSPRRYEVYPDLDGYIAVDTSDGNGQSVVVICESAGSALCLVNVRSGHRRARYHTAGVLPDAFLKEALAELEASAAEAQSDTDS